MTVLYDFSDHRCEDFGFLVRNAFNIGSVDRVAIQYDALDNLNYLSEIKSAMKKWVICCKVYKLHWIMLECSAYLIIRILRLTITRKKVIES